jgi:fumarate reductase subunit C
MPKTMPMIFIRGKRLQGTTITRAGQAATVATSLAVFALALCWLS